MLPVQNCYRQRFNSAEVNKKNELWMILCSRFFQKYIHSQDSVLDIGAGYCEFLNNIKCKKKIAVDINKDVKKFAGKGVVVIIASVSKVPNSLNQTIDVVFASNFFEHLNSKEEMINVLKRVRKLLKRDGKLMILQPNIDLVKESYWDFIDHKIALNGSSLEEALGLAGFKVEKFIKNFLPYTTKDKKLSFANNFIIGIYLKLPQSLRFFAGQSFVLASKV